MGSKEYFVYFEITYCTAGIKDPSRDGKMLQECAPHKKGAGRMFHSPRCSSRFAYERFQYAVVLTTFLLIRRTEPCGPWHDGGPEPCGRWQ